MTTAPTFHHREADRTLLFGRGALDQAAEPLGDGYTLLSTPRAAAAAPSVVAAAGRVVEVPDGRVDEVAGNLLAGGVELGDGERLVALGGGRVIDVTKALAAASSPQRTVAAIPTTVSGAEMTRGHRHAVGVAADTRHVRPSLVVNDPALSASHAVPQLAASSANALGHVLVALASERATPFSSAVASESAQRFARAWSAAAGVAPGASRVTERAGASSGAVPGGVVLSDADRDEIALGALLAGWAVDHSGLGLQHVLAQTAVRIAGVGHAEANAALLPESVAAVRRRRPEPLDALNAQLALGLEELTRLLRTQAGGDGLAVLAHDGALLERLVAAAAQRTAELSRIPPPPDADEIRRLYRAAAAAS